MFERRVPARVYSPVSFCEVLCSMSLRRWTGRRSTDSKRLRELRWGIGRVRERRGTCVYELFSWILRGVWSRGPCVTGTLYDGGSGLPFLWGHKNEVPTVDSAWTVPRGRPSSSHRVSPLLEWSVGGHRRRERVKG